MRNYVRLFLSLGFFMYLIAGPVMAGPFVYVSNTGTSSVSIVNTNSNQLFSSVSLGGTPAGIAVTPDGKKAYVNTTAGIRVMRVSDNTITSTISLPALASLKEVAVGPDSRRAYITDAGRNLVLVIDTSNDSLIATIAVLAGPTAIAVNPNSAVTFAYVLHPALNMMSVINLATNLVTNTIVVGNDPRGLAVTPDGTKAYVTNYGSNSISVVDLSSYSVTNSIAVGTGPKGIAITPEGKFAYVANSGSNNVSVVNLATNAVTSNIAVGTSPSGVLAASNGGRVYVSNSGSGTVSVINPRSTPAPAVISTVNLGGSPLGLGAGIPDWNTYGNSLQRINYNGNETTITAANMANLVQKWSVQLNGDIVGSPIIIQNLQMDTRCPAATPCDVIFIGDNGGRNLAAPTFWAIKASGGTVADGTVLWQTALGAAAGAGIQGISSLGISGTAFYLDKFQEVYVVGATDLYALDALTGSILWNVQVTDPNHTDDYVWNAVNSDGTWIYVAGTATKGSYQGAQGKVIAVKVDIPAGQGRQCWPELGRENCTVTRMWTAFDTDQGSGIYGYGGPSISALHLPTENQNYLYAGSGNHCAPGGVGICPVQRETDNGGDSVVALRSADYTGLEGALSIRQSWPGELPVDCDPINNRASCFPNWDMASTPILFQLPGCATPLVAAFQKQGRLFIFNQDNITAGPVQPGIDLPVNKNRAYSIGVAAFHKDNSNALFVRYFDYDTLQHCIVRFNPAAQPCQYNPGSSAVLMLSDYTGPKPVESDPG